MAEIVKLRGPAFIGLQFANEPDFYSAIEHYHNLIAVADIVQTGPLRMALNPALASGFFDRLKNREIEYSEFAILPSAATQAIKDAGGTLKAEMNIIKEWRTYKTALMCKFFKLCEGEITPDRLKKVRKALTTLIAENNARKAAEDGLEFFTDQINTEPEWQTPKNARFFFNLIFQEHRDTFGKFAIGKYFGVAGKLADQRSASAFLFNNPHIRGELFNKINGGIFEKRPAMRDATIDLLGKLLKMATERPNFIPYQSMDEKNLS